MSQSYDFLFRTELIFNNNLIIDINNLQHQMILAVNDTVSHRQFVTRALFNSLPFAPFLHCYRLALRNPFGSSFRNVDHQH